MPLFYHEKDLCLGSSQSHVRLADIAREARSPFYAYDWNDFLYRLEIFRAAFTVPLEIHYAMKANGNSKLLERISRQKIGVDIVSGGELSEALDAGFPGQSIIFSGVGKTEAEILFAIDSKIKQINVESPQELARIGKIAREKKAKVAVAVRMNPDVDPKTHPYITTGFRENKFGMDSSFIPELLQILNAYKNELQLVGTTIHIGSQLTDLSAIDSGIAKTIPIYNMFRELGHPMETFDIGGGLGIDYKGETPESLRARIHSYGAIVSRLLSPLGCRVLCEPGRILIAAAGVLVGETQYTKCTPFKNFLITDTGMHQLIRPALYQAFHRILPLELYPERKQVKYEVVGPICESSDVLGSDRLLQETFSGEYIAIADAGAYGFSMSSHYNSHRPPLEFLVEDGKFFRL